MPINLREYDWGCVFPDSNVKVKLINKSLPYRRGCLGANEKHLKIIF